MSGHRPLAAVIVIATIVGISLVWRQPAESAPPPAHCVEHTPLDGGRDVAGDMRCAGLVIDYHHDGPAASPSPVWAGQWLVTDVHGDHHLGWCVDHRGDHPLADEPSRSEVVPLPNDPGGRRAAYLAWRYGDTSDDLTAAALWMVFHHYALDPAGEHRSATAATPLVASLDTIAAATGRADLQAMATALHTEAQTLAGDWRLAATADDTTSRLIVAAAAGAVPVGGVEVSVLVSGSDMVLTAVTGDDGAATVPLPSLTAGATVVVTAEAPGPVVGLRGVPARADVGGAQLLVAAGPPRVLRVSVDLGGGDGPSTTDPPTTDPGSTPPTTAGVPGPDVPGVSSVPVTGGPLDGSVAQAAVATLVAGAALLGTLRRRSAAR